MERQKELLVRAVTVACDTTDYIEGLGMVGAVTDSLATLTQDLAAHARSEGRSWKEIGDALGISRSAAQQRFGAIS